LFSLQLAPHVNLPLGRDTELFKFGGGSGFAIPLSDRIGLRIFGKGGYYYGLLHDASSRGGNPFAAGGAGVYFRVAEPVSIGVDSVYQNYFGLSNDLSVRLSAVFHFGPEAGRRTAPGNESEQRPELLRQELGKEEGLGIRNIEFDNIFPVFFKYYDNNPVGGAVIYNPEDIPLEEIEVTFFVKQYMDNPKTCSAPGTLGPGEEADIDLYALFTDDVLSISEGTKVSAQIELGFARDGKRYTREAVETIRLFDRNATTWDDDRKAAAFVTAKDSNVLRFAKNVAGMTKGTVGSGVNPNLLTALSLHTALSLYGMSYVVDPGTPYAEFSKQKQAVDYLQFPKQTLEYKAGDCDDLSILYAALLEAVGIETAFITVPGHIFLAFNLAEDPFSARTKYLRPDEFIFLEDSTWVPVEVTELQGGFLKAWETGAREWRQHSAREQAGFLPMRESWKAFEPVGFESEKVTIQLPEEKLIVDAVSGEVTAFVDREIAPRVAKLQAEIYGREDNRGAVNRLGVLYAQYGLYGRAETEFRKNVEGEDYLPSLINLGNLYFLRDEMKEAKAYYDRAYDLAPDNSNILLCIARVNHELENYGTVQDAYGKLKEKDPDLAARYSYLGLRGDEAERAAEIGQTQGVVERTPLLDWSDAGAAAKYQVQVAETEQLLGNAEVVETTVSEYELPGPVTINDTFAWRARIVDEAGEPGEWSAVSSFSVAPSSTPVQIDTYDTGGNSFGPAVKGDYLFAAAGTAGLQILDFSDPSELKLVTTFESEPGAEPYSICISGDYAYVSEPNVTNSFKILDITAPASPTVEGTLEENGGWIVHIGMYTILSSNKVVFLDTSDLESPSKGNEFLVTSIDTDAGEAWKTVTDGVYLYTSVRNGLFIFKVYDESFVGSYDAGKDIGFVGVDKKGDYAYLSAESSGLLIIDVSDPADPVLAETFTYPGGIFADVIISGSYLFTNYTDGLLILDITDPLAPEEVGTSDTGLAWGTVTGNYCLCGNWPEGEIYVVDLLPAE
jgi:tetratricopeptide (TPR) repeat protein